MAITRKHVTLTSIISDRLYKILEKNSNKKKCKWKLTRSLENTIKYSTGNTRTDCLSDIMRSCSSFNVVVAVLNRTCDLDDLHNRRIMFIYCCAVLKYFHICKFSCYQVYIFLYTREVYHCANLQCRNFCFYLLYCIIIVYAFYTFLETENPTEYPMQ